jgi:protein-tyrosine kinase
MGNISDAFEKRERQNLLKIDRRAREQPINLPQGRPREVRAARLGSAQGTNGKLVVLSDPESADAENIHLLRSRIFDGREGEVPRTIMVTSAFPGEGKTFVASNLATSVAVDTDQRVLLIDCDLKKPSILQVFGCHTSEGVCEYLERKRDLDDLILATKIQRLSMLSAGTGSAHPRESGLSSEMERFMKEVKERFHDWIVIIDTAPCNVSAATRVIARYVDGVVFVVMAQQWPRKEVERSMELLGKEKILGVIFNGYAHGGDGYRKYYAKYYGKK